MTRRPFVRAALAALVLGSLAACSASPTPTPTRPPTSSPSSTPSPSEEAPTPAAIEVFTDRFDVVDDEGAVLASFDYFQATDEVVDGLTTLLGAPVDTTVEAGLETPAATYHDWGGLRLVDTVPPADPPTTPEHFVRLTSADANGVALRAFDGSAVGGPILNVQGEVSEYTNSIDGLAYRAVRTGVLPIEPASDGTERNFAVAVLGEVDADTITLIVSPSANFGV
ncbi:hypothetical protein ACFOE1_09715 [Agromyces mediolanus]|uniref:hypothetical protein n=1 Tax=Agromyces mediolanus TaxID=41986 RepID=UPI00166860C7|nr:hypothetical protein [Agromyces mediolanus]